MTGTLTVPPPRKRTRATPDSHPAEAGREQPPTADAAAIPAQPTPAPVGAYPRRPPGRLMRWFFDVPLLIYRLGLGRIFGTRFLLITHRGRRTGAIRHTVVEAVRFDPDTFESVVTAGWGDRTQWYRNLVAEPALRIETGGRRYRPVQRILEPAETYEALREYVKRNPWSRAIVEELAGMEVDGIERAAPERLAVLRAVAFRPDPRNVERDERARRRRTTRRVYDLLARWYDAIAERFEKDARCAGLRRLDALPAETIVEFGCGTGSALADLGWMVGTEGRVIGIDLAPRMVDRARERLATDGLGPWVTVHVGDGTASGLAGDYADGAFLSFVLESMDDDDRRALLAEVRRVLRPDGRLVVVALDEQEDRGPVARLYGVAHRLFPEIVDCRPIPVAATIAAAGFDIEFDQLHRVAGIPVAVVRARPTDAVATD